MMTAGTRTTIPAGWQLMPSPSTMGHPTSTHPRSPRWNRIAREALQQSGLPLLPEIQEPISINEIPANDRSCRMVCHTKPAPNSSLHRNLSGKPREVELLIGPEGGLTTEEVEQLEAGGFRRTYLGSTVLRVDTAAVKAVSAVRTLLEEKDDWQVI